jgi:hypothetical protein
MANPRAFIKNEFIIMAIDRQRARPKHLDLDGIGSRANSGIYKAAGRQKVLVMTCAHLGYNEAVIREIVIHTG